MTWKLGVGAAIMKELFDWESAFHCGKKILSGDTVTYRHAISIRFSVLTIKDVALPASSNTMGRNSSEWLNRESKRHSSGTVSYAPPDLDIVR
jgi:hypothetical protein